MIFCRTSGFDWEEIYNWDVDEFTDVYHAVQRNRARDTLSLFSTVGQAFGGDKKSVKEYVKSVSVWLPAHERGGGAKSADDFITLMREGKFKLEK